MTNRVALVTGGNRGIGLAACRQLLEKGFIVAMGSRDAAKGRTAAEEMQIDTEHLHVYALDVTDPESIQTAVSAIEATFGRLDVLINNAGIFIDRGVSGFELDIDTLAQTFEVNVYGPLRMAQAVIRLMRANDYGRIVNVSSRMGQLSDMDGKSLAYRVSKTALNGITAVLAQEVAGENILINAMTPGWVRTDMGGSNANRSVDEGADTITWLATLPDDGPSSGFFFNREQIAW